MPKTEKNTLPNSNTVGKGVSGTSHNESKTTKSTETEVDRELQRLKDNDKVHGIVRDEYDSIKSDRFRIDWKFKIAEMFYRGDIYAQYNKNTLAVETPRPKRGEIRVELPIIKTLVDANVTDMVKDKPEWDVLPESYKDNHIQEAKWNNLLLDYQWEQEGLAEKIEQVAESGVVKSIGILEAGWNPDKDSMYYDVVRPEDFYVNPKSDSFEDAIAVFKVIAKDTATVRSNPLYSKLKDKWWHELKADKDYTESEDLKSVQDRDSGTSQNAAGNTSRGTVLLVEGYYSYYDKDRNKKYRIVTFGAKQPLLFRNDEVEYGRMPWFFPFHSDKHPGEIYGQGKVIPIASAVKNIADIVSKTVRHHQIFTNGAYVVDRGADPVVVDGEAGKIIYKQPGRQLTPLTIPQLPSSAYEQVQQLMNFVQDSAGVHETSLGRPPAKIESARGLESLTFGDQQAKALMKQNFERFLVNVAKYTLKCISMNMSDEKIIKVYDDEGKMQKFAARGSESFEGTAAHPQTGAEVPAEEAYDAFENTLVVRPKEDVKVVIGSGLGNTPEARYAKAQELRETGAIGVKHVLKAARIPGNLSQIADEAWEESMRAEEARKDKPPEKDTKDYINTKFSDLSKDEQDQLIERYGIQVGQLPRPTSPQFQADIEDAKLPAKIQAQQAGNEHSQMANLAQQEASSMNPLIPGGLEDIQAELQQGENSGQPAF